MEKIKQVGKTWFTRCNRITIAVFMLGILIAASISYLAVLSRDSGKSQKFNDQVAHIEHTIRDNFDFYLRILDGAEGFFAGSEFVSRSEWDAYMSKLNPETFGRGIRFMSYIAEVPAVSKNDFLNKVRKDYLFYSYLADYKIYPERDAEIYYPVNYIYPLSGFERGLGFDLGSQKNYLEALETTKDSGVMEMIGPLSFAVDLRDFPKKDFLILHPVYKSGRSADTADDRRDSILGFVALGLSSRDFVHSALSIRNLESDLNVAVYHGTEISENNLLYTNYSRLPDLKDFNDQQFSKKFQFDFDGTSWIFYFTPRSEIGLGDFRDLLPMIVLGIGLAFNLLVSWLINTILSSKLRAEKAADEAIRKFQSAKLQYVSLADESSDPIIQIDGDGIVKYINKAGTDLIGYSQDEIIGKTILETGTVDITDLPKVLENFKADIRGEETPPFDLNMIKKNGERLILEANSSMVGGSQGIVQVIFRDVTRKRLEEGEFKKYTEDLERINKLMVDRELKIIDLKAELEKIRKKPI